MKNNYVYVYYVGSQIVYVGIGTDKDEKKGSFTRARQISGHKEVEIYKKEEIEIRVVSENLSRLTALAVEGLLIRTLKPLGSLCNVQNGTRSKLIPTKLDANGNLLHLSTRLRTGSKSRDPKELKETTSKAGEIGGKNKRKYTPELAKEIQKVRVAIRNAQKEVTKNKWRSKLESLLQKSKEEKNIKEVQRIKDIGV